MLDVVTIDGRVSWHLLVPSRELSRGRTFSQFLPFSFETVVTLSLAATPRNMAHVVPRSRLSRDYSLKHYWLDASAGGTNSGLFHVTLLSLSLSRRPLSQTHSLAFVFMYLKLLTLENRLSTVTIWILFRNVRFDGNQHRIV